MTEAGTVFIQTTAARPDFFLASPEASPLSWTAIERNSTAREEEARLASTGWTFFFLAQPMKTRVYGFDAAKRLATALDRLVAIVREKGCNGMQIDAVETGSWFGIPSVTVSGHPRHIQKGMAFVAQ